MFLLLLVEKWVHSKKNVYYAVSNLFLEITVCKRRNSKKIQKKFKENTFSSKRGF